MKTNGEFLENGLKVSVDWISFTVVGLVTVDEVIEFMGFVPSDFVESSRGANGYKRMMRLVGNDVSILFDGREDMGIHVNVSGSSISKLLNAYKQKISIQTPFNSIAYQTWNDSILADFLREVSYIGHFTRLDLAIDDYECNYFTMSELADMINDKMYVSKWHTHEFLIKKGLDSIEGFTIYFGSKSSDIRLRIYDKKLEQNSKIVSEDNMVTFDWVRWELQLRGNRASECAKLLANDSAIGEVAVGILSQYFRLIQLDNNHRSRCSLDVKWCSFISNIRPLKLFVRPYEKTLNDKKEWINRQVAPSLSALVVANNWNCDFLLDMIEKNVSRITPNDKELIRRCNPIAYDDWIV